MNTTTDNKIQKAAIDDTNIAVNSEAKPSVYLVAETKTGIADAKVDDSAAALNLAITNYNIQKSVSAPAADSGYIGNTTANVTTTTVYDLKDTISQVLGLSPEQIAALENYATANDIAGLRNYLAALKADLEQQLKGASKTAANAIKNKIGIINQLLGASDAVMLSTIFNTQVLTVTTPATAQTPETTETPTAPTVTSQPPAATTTADDTTAAANTTTTKTVYDLKDTISQVLGLSPEQIAALENYATANDIAGLRNYLAALKADLEQQLKGASKTAANAIKNKIGIIDQLLGASDTVMLSTMFTTRIITVTIPESPETPVIPETPEPPPPPPLEPLKPNPIYDLGIIIDAEITALLTGLEDDSNYYEEFYAEVIKNSLLGLIYLTPEQKLLLEQTANTGDDEALKKCLQDLIGQLSNQLTELQKNNKNGINTVLMNKIKDTIGIFRQLLTLPADQIHTNFFEKVPTGFWIFKEDAFEQICERVRAKLNILAMLTKLVHAKMDSANIIHQIMTEHTGYQKMNIEKINSRQFEAVSNFTNTRKKEIADRINNHNQIEKNKIEQSTAEEQEEHHGNLFLNLLAGIVSFIAGILATIFSGGVAAPVVVAMISTTFETLILYRNYQDDEKIKKEQEKLEENLALLRAAEEREQRKILERRREQLEQLQNTQNQEYKELLELELASLNAALETETLETKKTTGEQYFSVTNYLRSALTVQSMTSLYRAFVQIKLEAQLARNRITEELAVPGANAPAQIPAQIQTTLTQVFEMFAAIAGAQLQRNQHTQQLQQIRAEIKKNETNFIFSAIGNVVGTIVNLFTFNLGSSFIKTLITSSTQPAFNFFGTILSSRETPSATDASAAEVPTGLIDDTVYAEILSATDELSYTYSKQKRALSYTALLKHMQQLDVIAQTMVIEEEIMKTAVQSRSMIHQLLTDVSPNNSTGSAAATGQQYAAIMKDTLQKQATVIQQQITQYNQRVEQWNSVVSSGLSVIFSAASGLLSGLSSAFNKAGRTRDGFFLSLGSFVLESEEQDLYALLTDSEIFNTIENSYFPYPAFGESMSEQEKEARDAWFTTTGDGTTMVNLATLQAKYTTLTRKLLTQQALHSLVQAKHSARNLIHMEMGLIAPTETEISDKTMTATKQHAQEQFSLFVDQLSASADLLNQRNTRLNQMKENLAITLISLGISQVALASGGSYGDSQATLNITRSLLSSGATLVHILDNSLQTTLDTLTENTLDNSYAGEHARKTIEEQEQDLLNQALRLKNNTTAGGLQGVNLVQLEYINILLRKLQAVKDLLMKIGREQLAGRSEIHGTLTAVAGDTALLSQEISAATSQYMTALLQTYKKQFSAHVQRLNQQHLKNLERTLQLSDHTLSAARSISGLTDGQQQETARLLTTTLSDLLPLLRVAALAGAQQRHVATVSGDGLSTADQEALAGAAVGADLELLQTQNAMIRNNQTVIAQAVDTLRRIMQRSLTKAIMQARMQTLLQHALLEQKQATLSQAQNKLTNTIAEINKLFANLHNNSYYASHLQAADAAAQVGDFADAVQKLDTYCTPAFYQTVGDFTPAQQQTVADLRAQLLAAQTARKDVVTAQQDVDKALARTAELADALPAAIENLTKNYNILLQEQQEYLAATEYCSSAGVQQEINNHFPVERLFAENILTLLTVADSEFQTETASFNQNTVQALQTMRQYQSRYRSLLSSATVLIMLQQNRQAFEKFMKDYTLAMLDITGSVPDIVQASIAANALYAGYAPNLKQLEKFESAEKVIALWKPYLKAMPEAERESQSANLTQVVINLTMNRETSMPANTDTTAETYTKTGEWLQKLPEQYIPLKQTSAQAWSSFFSEQKVEKPAANIELEKRYTQTTKDLQIIEQLFNTHGVTENVPFVGSELSPEFKVYISQMAGNSAVINQSLRNAILNYVTRKRENCEIDMLKQSTDRAFVRSSLAKDFARLESLNGDYTQTCLEYELTAKNNPTDPQLKLLAEKLSALKYQLDTTEAAISRKNRK